LSNPTQRATTDGTGPASTSRRHPLAVRLTAFVERRAGTIVAVFLLASIAFAAVASKIRIDQELRRLLPDDYPSVVGIDRIGHEIGNQADLYLSIRSPSREANVAFGTALAEKLDQHPDLRFAIFRRDRAFFEQHALLYADLGDLLELRRKVILRIREEVRKQAFSGFSLLDEPKPGAGAPAGAAGALGLTREEIEARYGANEEFKEYYEADEGRLMVMRVRPRNPPTDIAAARALQLDIRAIADALEPTSFHPELDLRFNGSYATIDKRVRSFRGEVVGGSLASLFVLVASISIYFRSLRSALVVFVPLVGATVSSLAFAAVAYGFLNLVSAFIFAILLGLGIDFAIVLLSRYRDERARGLGRRDAFEVMLSTTAPASLFGGASTALGFGVLAVADFQGFAQFGVVATVGVFAALGAAIVVMPAMIVLLDRVRPWDPPVRRRRSADVRIDGSSKRWFGIATVVVVAALGVVAFGLARARDLAFEYDFDKLGPAPKPPSDTIGYRAAVGEARTVAPAVAVAKTPDDARAIHRQLAALDELGPEALAAFDPEIHGKPLPRAPWPVPPDDEPLSPPPAKGGDDWDAVPSDAPATPTGGDDDWDAAPADAPAGGSAPPTDAPVDELDAFGDPDLDDPTFVALETLVTTRPRFDAETLALLDRYDRSRLVDLAELMNDSTSLFAFIPDDQDAKLAVIADIRRRIDDKRGSLSAATRKDLDEWYAYLGATAPITIEALPRWVRAQFADANDELGRYVVVWTRGSKTDYRNVKRIYDAYGTLETPDGAVELSADFFVIPEVYGAIERDGPKVVLLSFCVMLVTSIATFRSLSAGVAAALMVPFSITSLLSIMYLLGWKLNFFNVIALPLLVGMGEDSALHIIARYREEGRGGLALAVRETGGAVLMTAWTTICGFASILFADHRGLQSLAWVSVIGVMLVFFTAVILLPALILVVDGIRHGKRDVSPPA
jgi:predicted exporter